MSIQLNSAHCVANLLAGSQFEPNETEYACGFFAVAVCLFATLPDQPNNNNWEQVDQWADKQYSAVYGSYGASQTGGISIDQLHTVIKNAGNLHYYDISAIAPGSAQSSDIAHITAALKAGYPVIATIVESSVFDMTGDGVSGNPYEWNPQCNQSGCPTHVIVYVGVTPDGNLLVWDYANVVGPLQGSNTVRAQPRKYSAANINNTFATVIQLEGLQAIPSDDPTSWPAGFNAQVKEVQVNELQMQMQAYWNATTARPAGGNILAEAGIFPAGMTPPYTTGIAKSWQERFSSHDDGPPVTYEMSHDIDGSPITDWQGTPLTVQFFQSGSRCEWKNGNPNWY
jgi:hypothetical protein